VALPVAEGNLQQFLEARAGIVATSLARRFTTQIASGLAYMHNASMMHRDLKPCNVLMTIDDTGVASLWIADMGRARRIPAMAPRRCTDKKVVNDSRVGVDRQYPNMTPGQRVWISMPQGWVARTEHHRSMNKARALSCNASRSWHVLAMLVSS
jgi:serine/threonine protein kinase